MAILFTVILIIYYTTVFVELLVDDFQNHPLKPIRFVVVHLPKSYRGQLEGVLQKLVLKFDQKLYALYILESVG